MNPSSEQVNEPSAPQTRRGKDLGRMTTLLGRQAVRQPRQSPRLSGRERRRYSNSSIDYDKQQSSSYDVSDEQPTAPKQKDLLTTTEAKEAQEDGPSLLGVGPRLVFSTRQVTMQQLVTAVHQTRNRPENNSNNNINNNNNNNNNNNTSMTSQEERDFRTLIGTARQHARYVLSLWKRQQQRARHFPEDPVRIYLGRSEINNSYRNDSSSRISRNNNNNSNNTSVSMQLTPVAEPPVARNSWLSDNQFFRWYLSQTIVALHTVACRSREQLAAQIEALLLMLCQHLNVQFYVANNPKEVMRLPEVLAFLTEKLANKLVEATRLRILPRRPPVVSPTPTNQQNHNHPQLQDKPPATATATSALTPLQAPQASTTNNNNRNVMVDADATAYASRTQPVAMPLSTHNDPTSPAVTQRAGASDPYQPLAGTACRGTFRAAPPLPTPRSKDALRLVASQVQQVKRLREEFPNVSDEMMAATLLQQGIVQVPPPKAEKKRKGSQTR